jgi:hypothetical protein
MDNTDILSNSTSYNVGHRSGKSKDRQCNDHRSGKSKDRQYNGQKKKDTRTNNDLQNTTQKTYTKKPNVILRNMAIDDNIIREKIIN